MTLRYDPATGRAKLTIYAGRDANGRQRQRSRTWHAANLRAAQRDAARFTVELRTSVEARLERMGTVDGLVDEWQRIRDAKDSPTSVRGRQAILRRIRAGLGGVPLDQLSARHVDSWMAEMRAQGLADTTIASHHTQLRAILNQGDAWEMVSAAATRRAKPPKRQRRRPQPPTSAAVDVLVGTARPDLQLAAELAAQVGMRRGEVLGLMWGDIDWANRLVHVNRALVDLPAGATATKLPKSGQPRTVPVSAQVIELLDRQRRRHIRQFDDWLPDGYVIADLAHDQTGGTPRKANWLSRAWQRHRQRQGSAATFHDLRHWHATELIDAGVPAPVVQARLGHLQLSTTTNVYTHAVGTSERTAADLISKRRALDTAPASDA